jgi:hypothetical protein
MHTNKVFLPSFFVLSYLGVKQESYGYSTARANKNQAVVLSTEVLPFFLPNKVFSGHGKAGGAGICLPNKEFIGHGKVGGTANLGATEKSRNYCKAIGAAFFLAKKRILW